MPRTADPCAKLNTMTPISTQRSRSCKLSTCPFCMGLPVWIDQADFPAFGPAQHPLRRELRTVVRTHVPRPCTFSDPPL